MRELHLYSPSLLERPHWPRIEACYSRTWRDFEMRLHSHGRTEIMYVFKGSCSVFCLESGTLAHPVEREYRLGAGDYILIDAEIPHRLYAPTDRSSYLLNAEFGLAPAAGSFSLGQLAQGSQSFRRFLSRARSIVLGHDAYGDLFKALNQMLECHLKAREDSSQACLEDAAMAFFWLQLACAAEREDSLPGLMVHVRKALTEIHQRYAEKLTVTELASRVGVHPAYLQRIFKRTMGMPILEYVTRARISKAAYLLANTGHSVVDIALESGFGTRQHFTRCFKMRVGCSPIQYRQRRTQTDRRQVQLSGSEVDFTDLSYISGSTQWPNIYSVLDAGPSANREEML